jgi:hypothetical protein
MRYEAFRHPGYIHKDIEASGTWWNVGMRQKPMEPRRVHMGEAMRTAQNVREERQRKGKRI